MWARKRMQNPGYEITGIITNNINTLNHNRNIYEQIVIYLTYALFHLHN